MSIDALSHQPGRATRRRGRIWAAGIAAAALVLATTGIAAAAKSLADKRGDTVNDADGAPHAGPQADITESSLDSRPGALRFAVRVVDPSDPGSDEAWTEGVSAIDWLIDTTGDRVADYAADFFNENGLQGTVRRTSGGQFSKAQPPLCRSQAAFAGGEYSITFDPACIRSPANIAYQVNFYYDTDHANRGVVVTDWSPDRGVSEPIPVAAPAGG